MEEFLAEESLEQGIPPAEPTEAPASGPQLKSSPLPKVRNIELRLEEWVESRDRQLEAALTHWLAPGETYRVGDRHVRITAGRLEVI